MALRKVYILPNLFTAASLFCGMLAIFKIFDSQPEQACWLILLSGVLDVFDGWVARLTRTTSSFGLHFDSLSDLVAFGAAPSVLAFHAFGAERPRVAVAVCGLFVICGALRLARFNIQALKEEKKTFTGLPIPAAALAAVSMIWVFDINTWLREALLTMGIITEQTNVARFVAFYPFAMVVLAYLMVSKVPYIGFKSLALANRQPFEILVTVVIVSCLLFLLYTNFDVVLFFAIWGYILAGIAMHIHTLSRAPIPEPLPAADPDQHHDGM